jgi:3-deoxy-D-manno-octulosonic-acid transferase
MSKKLSLILYNVCIPLGVLIMAPSALVKMRRRGGRWSDFAERLGRFSPGKTAALEALSGVRHRIWMHAVSVGEVGIARRIIMQILKEDASVGVILTTTTPTGHQLASEFSARHADRVVVTYSPLDLRSVARRFLKTFQPTQLVLVEAEVWPNLVSLAHDAGIPVSLVNARLSPRSEARFGKLRGLVGPVFEMLSQILVQEPEDAARWVGLGVQGSRVHYTGSVKFDPEGATVSPSQIEKLRSDLSCLQWQESSPSLLAASTHAGEEIELGRTFLKLKARHPELKLIIVPRHVERTAEIAAELRSIGLEPLLRTELKPGVSSREVVLVNTTGELSAWQHLATMIVIGKSFLAHGGQNPAEALEARKPVLYGPNMENFEALVKLLLHEKGALQVRDFAELEAQCELLLDQPEVSAQLAAAGHAALTRHSGATSRTVERLRELEKII